MVGSIGKTGLGAVQQQRLSGELQEPAQFGERIVQSGKAKGSVAVALSTGWLSIKHFFKSLFRVRVSVDKPPQVDTAQDAGKALIHALTRRNVDLLSVVGNLGQLLKLGQFPRDEKRQGLTEGAGKVLRQEFADLTDMQLWRLYQNLKANPELLALGQLGTGTLMVKMTGLESEEQNLQNLKAAGGIDDTGFVLMSLEEEVTKALTQRGYVAPRLEAKDPSDDHVLNSVIDRVFKLDGDVDLAVKQMKAERRQRTIDFAMSTMPGLLKVKVQTVRVAEKPEVLKDQAQVGQRPKKVDPKLQADRLALEREEARNKLMEQTAIQDYTTAGGTVCFREINGWLRNPKGKLLHADVVKRKVALIKSGLAKLPDHQGEVYRGTHLTKEQLEAYSVGKRLVEAAFTSTSRSIIMGQSYADPAENGDRVPVLFVIDSKHGKSIEDYSAFRHEKEVLFTAGTAFEVTGRSVDAKGRHVVHMRDVDEQQNA
jgi:hypothetical protein